MKSFNQAIVVGHLGADPEIRGEGKVASFSIATTKEWGEGDQKKSETTWHRCVCFKEGLVEHVIKAFVKKGSAVMVKGELKNSSYEKEGIKHSGVELVVDELILVGGKQDAAGDRQAAE
jgi:single-strand DNA-binding protein